jgi:hypothetical protein
MKNSNQVLDEFNTNLDLLKISYKVLHMNLTRDRTNLLMQPRRLNKVINYTINSESKNTRKQTNGWTRDLFAKVQNHQHMIPTSPLKRLALPTKSQLQAGSL